MFFLVLKIRVKKIIQRYGEHVTSNNYARADRSPKLSPLDKQYFQFSSLSQRRKSSSTLATALKKSAGPDHIGLKGCVAVKKPIIRKGKGQKRRKFAN